MEVIDADWIKSRLTGMRGERARLAEAIGIDNDKMSKTLKGLRRVQSHEVPAILAFFGVASKDVDPELAELWSQLEPEERVMIVNVAREQIAARNRRLQQSDEEDE